MNVRNLVVAAFGATLLIGGASAATAQPVGADPAFAATHPARAELNQRLDNQDRRIDTERASGEIGRAKAHRLHMADRRIRRRERQFASRHGGHMTAAMQARLNHRENRVSHRIG